MFQANTKHQQRKMFTAVDQFPDTARKLLEKSWAKTFYDEYFCKIDERVFSVLYSNKKSRPNTPVNILMGFETLKSGFGWSDEELYNHFLFDLQVRYALGLEDFAMSGLSGCFWLVVRKLTARLCNLRLFSPVEGLSIGEEVFLK